MRITCPNCLAQYEIDGGLLPAEGREVQCSACDTIWFQPAPVRKAARPTAPSASAPNRPPEVRSAPSAPESVAPAMPQPQKPVPPPAQGNVSAAGMDAAQAASDPTRPRPRSLDPAVSEVLRQEAEFEAAQRKREAGPVEMQPDLGLLGGSPWPAFRDPDEPDADRPLAPNTGSPSSFPDIDDVSATLDPINARRQTESGGYDLPLTAQDRQRGFLQGFILPIALGALVVGLYLAAPLLSALVPPAAPILSSYVAAIDTGRMALAQLILGR